MIFFKKYPIFSVFFFSLSSWGQVPVINSFDPASGPIGTVISVSGNNFSSLPENNIVYLGAVRAKVISATNLQLTVEIPAGATSQRISVAVNYLIGYSKMPFNITFQSKANRFIATSFAEPVDLSTNLGPNQIAVADFNHDGKADIVVGEANSDGKISVFKNLSHDGEIKFAPAQAVPQVVPNSNFIAAGDLNGDGRPDVVVVSNINGCTNFCNISVLKNIYDDDNIAFSVTDFPTAFFPSSISIDDIDGDGKPDLVMSSQNTTTYLFSVLRNISDDDINHSISFAGKVDFPTQPFSRWGKVADLDGDGKPDFVVTNYDDSSLSVFRNLSTPGNIQFSAGTAYKIALNSQQIAIGDLNQDGRPDIAVVNENLNYPTSISILKNESSTGNISFAPITTIADGLDAITIAISDLDGDSKPDLVIENYKEDKLRVYKNSTVNNSFSFDSGVDFRVGDNPWFPTAADINNDGKPDLIASNWDGSSISVLKNIINESFEFKGCSPATATVYSSLSGSSYQWQVSTDNGKNFTNINDNANYSGSATDTLQIKNAPSSWYNNQYHCMVGVDTSNVFILKFENTWTGAQSTSWENPANWSCNILPDEFTDVIINAGAIDINSNVVCRSLKILPGVNLKVNQGYHLLITH